MKFKEQMAKKRTQDYWYMQYQKFAGMKEQFDAEKSREKEVEAVEALQRSQIPFTEDMKRNAEQVRRRKENEEREAIYAGNLIPKNEQKIRFMEKL